MRGTRPPRCPKKQQADNLARIAAEKRRLKTTPTDSAEPQKSQASQSRLTKPAKKYDQNYPLLPAPEPVFSFARFLTGPTT
ncbi:hypothetical protein MRX96_042294 [Rhipicephalus microplus]